MHMDHHNIPRISAISAYCMLMYCLGYARGALYDIQFGEKPKLAIRHLLPENIQKYVEVDLLTLARPQEPLPTDCFPERDRVYTSDDFCPVINIHTLSILYFALDSIRQAWSLASDDNQHKAALIDVNQITSLASLASRYGCDEDDLAVNTDEFIGNRGWDWYCDFR